MPFHAEISKAPKQANSRDAPKAQERDKGVMCSATRRASARRRSELSRYKARLWSTTGVAAVVGVGQRFTQIDDGQQQTNQGVVHAGLTT